ncbi:MAG: hypothetical protein E7L05_07300 [Clostridium sp.]|nr:hypothetical protein [Clostridium sp.]
MERQELLERLMREEIEHIRKIAKPYSRNKEIFWHDVVIKEKDLSNLEASGQFEFDEENYINYIYIETKIMDNYLEHMHGKSWWDSYCRKTIVGVIGHELTHAYVRQALGNYNKIINGVENDASPVFLATLQLFGYRSHHNCAKNFLHGNLNKKIYDIKLFNNRSKWWNEFKKLISDYVLAIKDFKEGYNNNQEKADINCREVSCISFSFSSRGSGLKKEISTERNIIYKREDKLIKTKTVAFSFYIGSAIQDIEDIKKLVYKKVNNNVFAEYYRLETNKVVLKDKKEDCKFFVINKNKNF